MPIFRITHAFLRLRTLLIASVLVAGLHSISWAGLDEGLTAYRRQDYATALNAFREEADKGNIDAQHNLGLMYHKGEGVPQDYKEALKWYRLAAAQGHANAQANLGWMYDFGRGVPEDVKEAARWYHLAAAQGNRRAQSKLGSMYSTGDGVPQLREVGYALLKLSDALDPSEDSSYSPDELKAGQALAREMAKPGNFGRALDAYVAQASKAATQSARPAPKQHP